LLVNVELLRAIRTESEVAISYWFGVATDTVRKWRRAFGVKQWGTEGSLDDSLKQSRRLVQQYSEASPFQRSRLSNGAVEQ
jgi:hypothetical protein